MHKILDNDRGSLRYKTGTSTLLSSSEPLEILFMDFIYYLLSNIGLTLYVILRECV